LINRVSFPAKDLIECCRELAVLVAEQELEPACRLAEVYAEVTGLPGQLLQQLADLWNRRASWGVRVGPRSADQAPVPGQHRT
jgi:hypothetical protein